MKSGMQPPPLVCPDFSIDVTYSPDSNMIHRFINFEALSTNHEKVFIALQKYVAQVEQDDQGAFMYHQIQEQYEEKMTTGVVASSREMKQPGQSGSRPLEYEKQITVAMVMDPDSLHPSSSIRKQIAVNIKNVNVLNFGAGGQTESRYKTLSKHEIESRVRDGQAIESSLSKWILQFFKFMSYTNNNRGLLVNQPRFSEIRPMALYTY